MRRCGGRQGWLPSSFHLPSGHACGRIGGEVEHARHAWKVERHGVIDRSRTWQDLAACGTKVQLPLHRSYRTNRPALFAKLIRPVRRSRPARKAVNVITLICSQISQSYRNVAFLLRTAFEHPRVTRSLAPHRWIQLRSDGVIRPCGHGQGRGQSGSKSSLATIKRFLGILPLLGMDGPREVAAVPVR